MKSFNKAIYTLLIIISSFGIINSDILAKDKNSDYKYLTDTVKDIEGGYELKPVIVADIYRPNYYYLKEKDRYLVQTGYGDILIDKNGNTISNLKIKQNNYFSESTGLYFSKDGYIDWFITGDKKLKKYSRIINKTEKMTKKKYARIFLALQQESDYLEIGNFGVVFKIGPDWILLRAGEANIIAKQISPYDAEIDFQYNYIVDMPKSMKKLDNNKSQRQFKSTVQIIRMIHSLKKSTIHKNFKYKDFISINDFKREFREYDAEFGTTYMKLFIKNSTFKIKMDEVEKKGREYNLGLRTFSLHKKYKKDKSLIFLESTQNRGFGRRKTLGVYIYKKIN